ncbi:MAG: phosphatidylserine decarboxylase [Bacteroidota bacterium]|nr:phosphatidylserine decarboxylase [Bacteroidota bacterium]
MRKTYIHKEGWKIILVTFFTVLFINLFTKFIIHAGETVSWFVFSITFAIFCFVTYFFRNPSRHIITDDDKIICPADGKVVVIEEVYEPEYFADKRLQVSVFMSPSNVHVNRTPIAGEVKYAKYHAGKYLVAWHPKSSTENERTSIVLDNGSVDVLMRQIAGKVARRIVYNLSEGDSVAQGADFGFIKFGSRVDLFLPLETKVNVHLGQKVKGGITIIGELPSN